MEYGTHWKYSLIEHFPIHWALKHWSFIHWALIYSVLTHFNSSFAYLLTHFTLTVHCLFASLFSQFTSHSSLQFTFSSLLQFTFTVHWYSWLISSVHFTFTAHCHSLLVQFTNHSSVQFTFTIYCNSLLTPWFIATVDFISTVHW